MSEKRELTLLEFINGFKEFCASHDRCIGCPLEDEHCNVQSSVCDHEMVIKTVTEFLENKNAPKPVETEWVWVCSVYKDCPDGQAFCGQHEILGENDTKSVEEILTEYHFLNNTYTARIERICRIKK